jgi:hypothetical protein
VENRSLKDGKQLLGAQYQNGTYGAAVTHLHLVCFAYALLTHIAIKREGAKGKKKKRKVAAPPSIAQLQNEFRRIVWAIYPNTYESCLLEMRS